MEDLLKHRLVITKDLLCNEVVDELVFLNLENETYFSLDGVGVRIWQLLEKNDDLQSVYEAILDEYDVGKDQLLRDMRNLVQQIVDGGLAHLEKKNSGE